MVVKFILFSTTGGHTATSPLDEWWVYGLGLAVLSSLNSQMDLKEVQSDFTKTASINQ
jgi:hypothetical protein